MMAVIPVPFLTSPTPMVLDGNTLGPKRSHGVRNLVHWVYLNALR